jgi:hypothetical protein
MKENKITMSFNEKEFVHLLSVITDAEKSENSKISKSAKKLAGIVRNKFFGELPGG